MAIEIKELHVRLFMDGAPTDPSQAGGEEAPDPCAQASREERIVQDAVQEVLRILKEKNSR